MSRAMAKKLLFLLFFLFTFTPFYAQHLKHVRPEKVGMDSQKLLKADSIIEEAIRQGDIPGAVLT